MLKAKLWWQTQGQGQEMSEIAKQKFKSPLQRIVLLLQQNCEMLNKLRITYNSNKT